MQHHFDGGLFTPISWSTSSSTERCIAVSNRCNWKSPTRIVDKSQHADAYAGRARVPHNARSDVSPPKAPIPLIPSPEATEPNEAVMQEGLMQMLRSFSLNVSGLGQTARFIPNKVVLFAWVLQVLRPERGTRTRSTEESEA